MLNEGAMALADYMKCNEISKDDAARSLEVSRVLLGRFLSGVSKPTYEQRLRIKVWTNYAVFTADWDRQPPDCW